MEFVRNYWQELSLVAALVVATILLVVALRRHRRATLEAAGQNPDDPSPAPYRLPVLPKGSAYVFGVVFSIIFAWLVHVILYGVLALSSGNLIGNWFVYYFAWGLSWLGGILVGIAVFLLGKLPEIPTGNKGLLRFLGGRISEAPGWKWYKILFPEGFGNWIIPLITSMTPIDMRKRPLIKRANPDDDVIVVNAQANVVMEPGTVLPTGTTPQHFIIDTKIKIAVRVQTIDPYAYLSNDDAEGILFNFIAEEVRKFVLSLNEMDIFSLPDIKEDLKVHLEERLDRIAANMGLDFVKIAVTDVELPKEILDATAKIPIEVVERAQQLYQGETIQKITQRLKSEFPGLSPRELKNLVLQTADLAKTTVTSFEGQAVPVVTPTQN